MSTELDDLDDLVAVQQAGAVRSLSHIFPQETHPFPRAEILRRWAMELADPNTHVYVSTDDATRITGFAATRGSELLHFGTSVESWGSGLAVELHAAVLQAVRKTTNADHIWLRVFEANSRARRFYERLEWSETGHRTRTRFAPNPVLVEYVRGLQDH